MLVYQGSVAGLRRWLRAAAGIGSLAEWIAWLSEN